MIPAWSALLVMLILKLSSSQFQVNLECLPGWEIKGHHCYKLVPNPLPWASAERMCASYGGHLALPFDYYENEDIGDFVNSQGVNEFWLGTDRIGVRPNDNGTLFYNGGLETRLWVGYWSVYQPKFTDGDCVYVSKDKNQHHKWSFGPCGRSIAFLCQRPVCAQGSFHCVNGHCISPKGKCDGYDDCGDRSDETDCPQLCSWYIKTSGQGVINYPNTGLNYSNNAACMWLIETDVGSHVQLIVTSLSLENNSDELIVMDGGLTESSSVEIVRLSGHSIVPQYFYSSDNKMLVKFRSDGSVTNIGFSVSHSQVNSSASSQNLTATNTWQELEFPYYNSSLLGNQDLSYVIEAEDQTKTVTFEVLDIDLPVDATAVIRDGNTVYSSILALLSGTYKGSGISLSSGRYLHIELHTVRGSQHRGLKVRYMQGCQASLDQSTGYISSPGYPVSFYPNGITCNWTVSVSGNKNMTIVFNRMDIHTSDRIQIIVGNSLIGNYSGNSLQTPLRIFGGQFFVVFISSATLNQPGFNLTYSVDCPQPAIDLNLSNIVGAVTASYGSEFTVTCKPGSQFFQTEHMGRTSVTMICMAFGQWNVNTSPKCERIQCQTVPSVQNGYLANSTGNLPYNGTLTYKCYQGYMLVGSDTVTCDANGYWINLPSCQASSCGLSPAADPNGNVTISVGNGSLYGTVLRYSCNQGYDLIGDPTLFCDSNGRYVGKAGTCKILTCYKSGIPNGVISSNKVQVGQQITLTCNPGYKSTTGENSMTCNSNRTLIPELSCQNINECDNTSICQHHCIDTEGSYYCTCNPGFEVIGNFCRDIDECKTVRPCDDVCTNTQGSYQCSCQAGYSLFVANGTQGHWIPPSEDGTHAGDVYHINHTCVRNLCPSPPVIANTSLLKQKTGYYYEDVVMYKCWLGYILENPMANTLTCSQNGTWTGLEIKCRRAACAVEPVATNLVNPGKLSPNNTSILFGEVLTITCDVPGFTPQIFSRRRQCTLVGSNYILDGSINDYECGFISCGKPPDEPGSNYTGLSTYYYGNSFTFTCQPTFKLGGASFITGNTTVTCQSNGQWDFGNLTCTGAQCVDPGQPYLGKQVVSDYREGQLVIFSCLEDGYTLRPPYPISCGVIQNGTPRFNGSLPACIDTQVPNITNCPQNDIIVARQISLGAAVPELQIQDNGGIKKIAVIPAWPSSQQYATSVQTPVRFTYTVTDYENNQAYCVISFRIKDDTPPTITCPSPYHYQFRTENDIRVFNADRGIVIVNDDGTPAPQLKVTLSLASYTFNPKVMLPPTFPPIVYKTVLATAEDATGNSANCSFELLIQPDACSPYSLRTPANSIKKCVAVGSGYNCTITCNRGYSLYNNILSDSVSVYCPASGIAFASVNEVKCVNKTSQDGSYKLEFDFLYEAQNIRNSCKDSYETTIRNTLQILTTNKNVITDTFCETGAVFVQGNITLGYLTVRETEKKVLVHYVVSFDRKLGSNYSKCAAGVKFIMGDPDSYLVDLIQYTTSTCEPITLTSNRSLTYEGYYCEDNTSRLVSPYGQQNLSYCLVCPEGTYFNSGVCTLCPRGTFGELPNINMCQPCPNNTSTYSSGAVSRTECASECDPGFSSASGLPPCDPCPSNNFWVNATTCLPCPSSGVTRGGGTKSQMDCKASCLPGTFNEIDGHEDCKICPLHHYSSYSALLCTECPYNAYTNSTGKTSISDCLQLSQTLCLCQNGYCVDRLPHIRYCICSDGWTGEYCNKSLDSCASHPCYNNGTCTSNGSKYICSCPAGTQGKQCQDIIKTCTPDYCQHNGMCENLVSRPVCHCLTGYTGDRCQTTQNICASQPCKNGGNCTAIGGVRFSCSCQSGFTGSTCEESKDDCYESPCRNNGTCRDGNIAFTCDCGTPYTGRNCETRNLLCSSVDCGPGARCLEDEMNNTYMCICNEYTELNSSTMTCKAKDLCARNPCLNNGSCISTSSSFICVCPNGYGGSLCQLNINDCLSMPCQNGGQCQDLTGTFYCNCSGTGFQGESCNLTIGDCASKPCNATGTDECKDVANAYHCRCRPGYTGKNCEIEINECDSDPCLHNATCLDMVNGYMCDCPFGWTGRYCETENRLCTTTTCLNGAMCIDYFNGYFCTCKPNTYEKNCSARVNICQVTNPCIHGSCQDSNGSFECKCDDGYEGDQCGIQQNFCNTNMSVCKNGGQCVPQLDSYECKCPQGYSGKDCSFTVDNCSSRVCPFESTCLNVDGKIYCRCPLDKEGQNCDKEWDQDFDLLFDHEHKIGMAYLLYPIKLNSTAFSISLWLQFGEKDATGTVLSLLTVPETNSLRDKHLLLWIDEKTIYYNGNGSVVSFTHDINYRDDGQWHYLVVNVNVRAGVLHFIVDTVSSAPVPIPVSEMYTNSVWLVLGSLYDPVTNMPEKDKGFYGKLSKVTFYSRELQHRDEITILGNTNVSSLFMNSIIRWNSEFKYSNGVIRKAPSEADKSCPFGFTNYSTCDQLLPGKRTVKIVNGQCPSDILQYSSDRLTQVFWSTPTFSGQDSLVSSFMSGDTFEWGKYSVVIQASNSDGNTALCLFNIFVRNDNCTTPETPPMADELQCSPAVYEKYKQCDVICKNNTAPSIPSPRLYTCGPDGNWDPNNKFVPYRISPCGAISQPSRQIIITLKYTVPTAECTAVKETLERELLKTLINLNNEWNYICTQANCSDAIIVVTCLNTRRRRQASTTSRLNLDSVLTLNNISDSVTSKSNGTNKRTEDIFRDLLLALPPANSFNYSNFVSDAAPTSTSINGLPMCKPPKVFQENQCVDCGPGTFYNETERECQFCPFDSFQSQQGQTSCDPCHPGTTTPYTGSYVEDDCYVECPEGQYRIRKPLPVCTNCSRGSYQPRRGQFSCLPCPADKTTKYTGTILDSDCANDCPPGQEIGSNNNCTACRIGFYRGLNDAVCQRCPNGTVTQNTSQVFESACNVADNPPGTKRDNTSSYDICPIGTYQSEKWQSECIPCAANYLTDHAGSTNVTDCKFSCPAGQEKKPNEDSCMQCQIGYFRDDNKPFDQCEACQGNFTTLTAGSTSRQNCTLYRCSAGEQPNNSSIGCELCPMGTYQELPDMPRCNVCSSGKSTSRRGASRQDECKMYCDSGYENNGPNCTPCQRGYYKDNTVGLFRPCMACDSKYVTPAGPPATNASQCVIRNCQAGSYINGDNCTYCPKGSFQDQPWQTNCTQCGPNRTTETDGATSIAMCLLSCPAGTENKGQSITCDPCMVGYYKDVEAAASCTPCGNFSENDIRITTTDGSTNITNCTKLVCLAGYYPVNEKCNPCDFGTYQASRWTDTCTNCPQSYTTYTRGAVNASDCEYNCSPGEELVNGTCIKCKIGFYNDKSDPSHWQCFPCPGKNITQQEGATSAAQCNIVDCSTHGQFRDKSDNKCKDCPIGTYQDTIRQTSCTNCSEGFTTQSVRSTSVVDCKKDCDSGYSLDNNTNTCIACPVGSYRNKTDGNWNCVSCGANLTTPESGSNKSSDCSLSTCSPGYAYDKSLQVLACIECPGNTYTDREGQLWPCKSCPNDQFTDSNRSSSLDQCHYPCSAGNTCNNVTEVCVNVQSSYQCDCQSDYQRQNNQCIHKCDIPNYCGSKGECIQSPFECRCRDGYSGTLCDIRPDASTASDQETETIIIAVVTTVTGLLFIILLIVCICVMIRKRSSAKTSRTSEIDEHTSITTRSMKGYDDYPTFAINPAFSSKPPSMYSSPNGALASQGIQIYNNPTYSGDEDNDPAVYRA